uniref:Uncharacterized protein n=1 Tax=Caenorhabditis japonica TaxID=281687 RepID=A0A8R1E3F6_CAEJA
MYYSECFYFCIQPNKIFDENEVIPLNRRYTSRNGNPKEPPFNILPLIWLICFLHEIDMNFFTREQLFALEKAVQIEGDDHWSQTTDDSVFLLL